MLLNRKKGSMTTFLWGLVNKESGSNDGLSWHRFACNIERWVEKKKNLLS
jgi:hypothetical protein